MARVLVSTFAPRSHPAITSHALSRRPAFAVCAFGVPQQNLPRVTTVIQGRTTTHASKVCVWESTTVALGSHAQRRISATPEGSATRRPGSARLCWSKMGPHAQTTVQARLTTRALVVSAPASRHCASTSRVRGPTNVTAPGSATRGPGSAPHLHLQTTLFAMIRTHGPPTTCVKQGYARGSICARYLIRSFVQPLHSVSC
jgi:hypothetical protein